MEPPDVCYDDYGGMYDPDYTEDDVSEYHGDLTIADYEAFKAADDKKFEKMWPTVEAIVRSIQSKPHEWMQDTYTIQHRPSKTVYWSGTSNAPITETFGGKNERVFSDNQGRLIRAAFNERHAYVPNDAQLASMRAFGTEPKPFVPEPGFWSNLWISIKFLPTLARFCMSRK